MAEERICNRSGVDGFPLSMLAFAVAYFIATVLLLNRYAKALPVWTIVMALPIGASLPDIYVRFLRPDGFRHSPISLPDFIVRLLAVGARRMIR